MKIGWALDMIGWAYAQPFPTLATPLPVGIRSGIMNTLPIYTQDHLDFIALY